MATKVKTALHTNTNQEVISQGGRSQYFSEILHDIYDDNASQPSHEAILTAINNDFCTRFRFVEAVINSLVASYSLCLELPDDPGLKGDCLIYAGMALGQAFDFFEENLNIPADVMYAIIKTCPNGSKALDNIEFPDTEVA